jgi:hypothetical protein
MKNLLAAFSLGALLVSANAADWVQVIDTPGRMVYLDKSSVVNLGSSEKSAWTLTNLPEPTKTSDGIALSYKSFSSYSCSDRTIKSKSVVFYTGPQGTGNSVLTVDYKKPPILNVPPDTTGEAIWKAVCNVNNSNAAGNSQDEIREQQRIIMLSQKLTQAQTCMKEVVKLGVAQNWNDDEKIVNFAVKQCGNELIYYMNSTASWQTRHEIREAVKSLAINELKQTSGRLK